MSLRSLLQISIPYCYRNARNFSSYKSSISLDKLHPSSSLNVAKYPQIPSNEDQRFGGFIPMDKIKISYSKSSGPGGMNVNKTNTKVDLRFVLSEADWIPEEVRNNMMSKYRNQVNKEGYLLLMSDRTRSQHLNTADALEKLREMIRSCEPAVEASPGPETLEKIRRRQERNARERLREKRERHAVKVDRGAANFVM